MLDLRKLRMLAELDRLGTIAAVGRALHLTAPGVSMQLAALERELGLQLTERQGRTLALTPAGRLLAQHGHNLVDMMSLAELEVVALRDGAAGTYRLAAFPSAARTIVARAWRTLLDTPELGLTLKLVELEPQDALPALLRGEVELALTHSYSNLPAVARSGVVTRRIASEPVWLAVPLAENSSMPAALADYADRDWILPDRRWSCWEMVHRACGLAGFEPSPVAEATDFAVILSLVSAGAGVALVPQLAIDRLPGNVALRTLVTPVTRHDFVITRTPSDADPGIRRLRELFASAAGEVLSGIPSPERRLDARYVTTGQ